MYVDWEYYKIFYYVAKYQNFTKAARVLGNNQPNITHAMNRLESQLNCVLFIRSNRGVTLTPEGAMLYSRIASAAVQIQDAEEELSASATLEHGAISISATETALNIYLSEKLRAFHTEYPGIRLRISNHSTPQAVQAVKNGEVDFAIVTTPAEVDVGLKMVELMPFYEVLVGGRNFTALASQSLTLKELGSYPLISLSEESMTRSFYRQFFLDHGAVLKPDTEAATTDQMLTLVKSELGLAFLPQPMAGEPLARGEIVDDDAMLAALDTGWVAAYVTDFPNNRLVGAPHVLAMPHLGASTPESEQNCAVMAVDQLRDYLENGNIRNSVNLPAVSQERSGVCRLCLIHKNVPAMLASITTLLSRDGINVENLSNKPRGDYAYTIVDLSAPADQCVIDEVTALENVIRVRVIQ